MTSPIATSTQAQGETAPATLVDFLLQHLAEPREHAFAERFGEGAWRSTASDAMLARAKAIASALHVSGVTAGDRVVVLSENRVDWIAAAFGTFFAGATLVPVFTTIATDQLVFVLDDSTPRLVFAESEDDAARARAARPEATVVAFGAPGDGGLERFASLATDAGSTSAAKAREAVSRDDLAVLIYTSGTTGDPKGVMLTHANLIDNARDASGYVFGENGPAFSPLLHVLPFAHIYAVSTVLSFLLIGADQYVTRPEHVLDDMKDLRPRSVALVPRIFERMLASIRERAKSGSKTEARLLPMAFDIAKQVAEIPAGSAGPLGLRIQHLIAERAVYKRIRERIGLDRVTLLGSGSAPLHRDIALTFAGMGLPITEGYGMTETGPVITVSRREELRFGTVGKAIPNVEIRTAEDGEIEVRGPGVMKGYAKAEGESPFTDDGWFRTGDVGTIDADGYLTLADRKKELFKTGTGKFVAPARVEAAIKRSIYIEQVTVVGDGRAFPIALVSPNWPLLRTELSLGSAISAPEAAFLPDVRELLEREVTAATADLATFEQVRYVGVLGRPLSIVYGELSPSLKTRRRVVETRYAETIDDVYGRVAQKPG